MPLSKKEAQELADLEELDRLESEEAQYQAQQKAPSGFSPTRALLTNEPTSGLGEDLLRSAPGAIGGAIGAIGGAGLASIPGAAAGGMAGESLRQAASQAYAAKTGRQFASPGQVIRDVGIAGASQAAGEGVLSGLGYVGKGLAKRVVPQMAHAFSGADEGLVAAAVNRPSMLSTAPTKEGVRGLYRSFEDASGTISPKLSRALGGELESQAQAIGTLDTMQNVLSGYIDRNATRDAGSVIFDKGKILADIQAGRIDPSDLTQLLYEASQGGAYLERLPSIQRAVNAPNASTLGAMKQQANELIELINPQAGYGQARQGALELAAKENVSSFFPLKQNLSPNALRSITAAGTFATGAIGTARGDTTYSPFLMGAALAASPMAWGAGIRAAGSQTIRGVATIPFRDAAITGARSLEEAYRNQK